jgi:hypothetical protein
MNNYHYRLWLNLYHAAISSGMSEEEAGKVAFNLVFPV